LEGPRQLAIPWKYADAEEQFTAACATLKPIVGSSLFWGLKMQAAVGGRKPAFDRSNAAMFESTVSFWPITGCSVSSGLSETTSSILGFFGVCGLSGISYSNCSVLAATWSIVFRNELL